MEPHVYYRGDKVFLYSVFKKDYTWTTLDLSSASSKKSSSNIESNVIYHFSSVTNQSVYGMSSYTVDYSNNFNYGYSYYSSPYLVYTDNYTTYFSRGGYWYSTSLTVGSSDAYYKTLDDYIKKDTIESPDISIKDEPLMIYNPYTGIFMTKEDMNNIVYDPYTGFCFNKETGLPYTMTEYTSYSSLYYGNTPNDLKAKIDASNKPSGEGSTEEEIEDINNLYSQAMQVRILHDEEGTVYEDLPWTDMQSDGNGNYFYNWIIPYDAYIGQYTVIYKSIFNFAEEENVPIENDSNKNNLNNDTDEIITYANGTITNTSKNLSSLYNTAFMNTSTTSASVEGLPSYITNSYIYNTSATNTLKNTSTDSLVQAYTAYDGSTVYITGNTTNYKPTINDKPIEDNPPTEKKNVLKTNVAYAVEVFHVQQHNELFEDVVKVFGHIHTCRDITMDTIIEDVRVSINDEKGVHAYQSLSDRDGIWTAYLYPGVYNFTFFKNEYDIETITAEIPDELNELPFENVAMHRTIDSSRGEGLFEIGDIYITKTGQPLNGLLVEIYDSEKPDLKIATDVTDDNGQWKAFVNQGVYLMNLSGTSMGQTYTLSFRIRVDEYGQTTFEDLSNNLMTNESTPEFSDGDGLKILSDQILDAYGNPISDVQVNAYELGVKLSDDTIIAQDYSDLSGKWSLKLNPGTYTIEYYHPSYKTITETRTI